MICICSSPGCPFQPYEAPGEMGNVPLCTLVLYRVYCSTPDGSPQSGSQKHCIGRSMSVPCPQYAPFSSQVLGMSSVCAAPRIGESPKAPRIKQDFASHFHRAHPLISSTTGCGSKSLTPTMAIGQFVSGPNQSWRPQPLCEAGRSDLHVALNEAISDDFHLLIRSTSFHIILLCRSPFSSRCFRQQTPFIGERSPGVDKTSLEELRMNYLFGQAPRHNG